MEQLLPGAELVERGIRDLDQGLESVESLLVSIGAPRLLRLGFDLPHRFATPEHRLYELLRAEHGDAAHSRYNALVRWLVSFERATAPRVPGVRELADEERIRRFARALGEAAAREGDCFLTGGATAVLLGWRATTLVIDIRLEPEQDELLRALFEIKEELAVNVELASPADFIPLAEGWRERSPFVAREGRLSFRHFDLYSQALAKLERGHAQDVEDVTEMLSRGLVEASRLSAFFDEIEPELYRFPAIDATDFRRAVETALSAFPQ